MEETTTTEEETTAKQEEIVTTSSTRRTVGSRTSKNVFTFEPITPTMTPEQAAAAVTHVDGTVFTKIKNDTAAVTTFNPDWKFTHHPGLTVFKGKIYAAFSQHEHGEDHPGQRMVVASSSDFYTWSEPTVVIDAFQGTLTNNKTAIVPCGIYVADGKLFVTAMSHDYGPNHFDEAGDFKGGGDNAAAVTTNYMAYTEDGVHWSEPVVCGALASDNLRQTYFGRWLCVSGVRFYSSDEKVPDGFFWDNKGLTNDQIADVKKRIEPLTKNPVFTESTWYQTKDNVLFMMSRSNTGVMYLTQSYDGGETWTDSHPTNFSSSNNQFPMGELPDGRIYAVGTPFNEKGVWEQWPLNLYVSKDGYNFDKAYTISDERYQIVEHGYSKGGYFGYPHVAKDDTYLYVLHSKMKEVMEIHRIKLSDIH